jgi:hypothetical protein
LWDEITGGNPRPKLNSKPPPRRPPHSHSETEWWRQDAFALDDAVPSPSTPNYSPATPSVLSSSSACSSSPNSASSSDTSPASSPGASPHITAVGYAAHCFKTRWQVYAERLFAHLLRIPRFSPRLHMQLLVGMHRQCNQHKDTQLVDIVCNYLATVEVMQD